MYVMKSYVLPRNAPGIGICMGPTECKIAKRGWAAPSSVVSSFIDANSLWLRSVKIPISSLPKAEKQDLWLDLQHVAEVCWLAMLPKALAAPQPTLVPRSPDCIVVHLTITWHMNGQTADTT